MNNKNLFGFFIANSIAGSMADSLRKQRMEHERKQKHVVLEETLTSDIQLFMSCNDVEGAYEYLNSHFNDEIIYAARHQNDYVYSLETIIEMRKDKYNPFYKRIGREMPEYLAFITADDLCEMLDTKNLHIVDKSDDKVSKLGICLLVVFLGILVLAIISL